TSQSAQGCQRLWEKENRWTFEEGTFEEGMIGEGMFEADVRKAVMKTCFGGISQRYGLKTSPSRPNTDPSGMYKSYITLRY
ncbi:MAG: hypothetical protein KOO63_03490, partial [Bacteroidales bacterium]|nr:hypothetical protein [Candidatus Latescibacterota bacterium]